MLLINCPWCGPRSETEFHCHGETRPARPHSYSVSEAEWIDYLTQRDNRRGVIEETWHHRYGCGEWFRLKRNTMTHQFVENFDEESAAG